MQSIENELQQVMPSLLSQFNSSNKEQEVELLQGIKGLEIVFREQIDSMKKNQITYVIGGTKGTNETAVVAFFKKIHMMYDIQISQ